MDKITARKRGLSARASLSKEKREVYDRIIEMQAIDLIRDADTVGCYVSRKDEVDTRKILTYCLEHGKRLFVPKTVDPTLEFHEIQSLDALKPGVMGILEPVDGQVIAPQGIDVMIVPLTAFDEEGHRTGYGKGYYDSILKAVRWKVGIAYPEQRVDEIETDPWDVDLDLVLSCNLIR